MKNEALNKAFFNVKAAIKALETELDLTNGKDIYQDAYNFRFDNDYNKNLDKADLDYITSQWHKWVMENQPETKDDFTPTGRPIIWVRVGGLTVMQKSPAQQYYRQLLDDAYSVAASRAKNAREDAGWTGKDFLTAPDGNQRSPRGTFYGPFMLPTDWKPEDE